MKYTKTAVAVAVTAGFAVAPMMASAETTLSGLVQVKIQGDDSDDDSGDPNIAAGDVRVAIGTEHEIAGGLVGYGNLQMNIDDLTGEGGLNQSIQVPQADPDGSLTDADDVELNSAATVSSDNVYVGVKGGFGDVRFGEIPLAVEYGQVANDIHDVGGTVVDGISYTGTFGPVGIGVNFSPEQDSDMIGLGAKFNFAGFGIGVGFESRGSGAADEDIESFAVGATYAIAGVSLGAHFWTQGNIDVQTGDDDTTTIVNDLDDVTAFAVQAGYGIAGATLGLTFAVRTSEVSDGVEDEQTVVRFDAGYDLGGGMDVSTRIQNTSTDAGAGDDPDDKLEYRVMLTKTF